MASLSTGLSNTNSSVATLSSGLSNQVSATASLSTGLSTTTSTVAAISTGYSTTSSNIASLSTGASTTVSNVASLSTGFTSLRQDALQWNSTLNAYDASHGTGVAQRITNVGVGTVSATSTDAVNGSQLYATNSSLASLSTAFAASGAGSNGSLSTGLSSLTTTVAGLSTGVSSLTVGLSNTNSSVASLSTGLSTTNSTVNALSSSIGGYTSSITSLSTGLSSTTVSIGSLSTGVVSLSTGLDSTNSSVAALSTAVANGGVQSPIRYGTGVASPGSASTTPNDLYLKPNSGTGPVVLHNVGAGSLAASSTDAINGGQIYTLGNNLASALGGGATFNSATGTITAPSYRVQGQNYSSVGGAINALDTGLTSMQNNLNVVTAALQQQITKNRNIASGGTASAFAMSQMRFSDRPGSQSLGMGGGFYDGQGAMAVGYGFTSEDGAWRGTASLSYAPGVNKMGVSGGFTYSW
ncbi:Autotransporter adhesin BadA [Methylobacterium aerolatum]|nr:Autotransporter adhesin BadA [Methylobacterium aerolatum]